ARADPVAPGAAENDVGSAGAGDVVYAAGAVVDRLRPDRDTMLAVYLAAVAQDHVGAVGAGEEVVAGAADQDAALEERRGIGAGHFSFTLDLVVAADVGERRLDVAADDHDALVAEDDVAAQARGDLVAAGAADHHVPARAAGDRVHIAVDEQAEHI